ncbi:clathrin light chain A isoform X4 [Corvus moneduloides]|uniref:clathrin light chain A isoform X4 n=1 Tax=Corvus moneduloides TaxID=1196302 RepID=UPI0013623430|nr:clathrin light chain A isoform X4 [Corvus moneduloides]
MGRPTAERRIPPPLSWRSRRTRSRASRTMRATASWKTARCPRRCRVPRASSRESNGPTDCYAAISQVDRLQSEPESIRKWREEQKERLEQLDANSRKQEAEWKEKAIKELEEWYARQDEKLEKTKASNRVADEAFYKQPFADVIGYVTNINHPCYSLEQAAEEAFVNDAEEVFPGTEWERVAQLCDFNPKSSKQAKDVSRMRSVLISLKQAPLVR